VCYLWNFGLSKAVPGVKFKCAPETHLRVLNVALLVLKMA